MALTLSMARKDFEAIAVEKTEKPLIGIVGEIFVRNHPYSNNDIIEECGSSWRGSGDTDHG